MRIILPIALAIAAPFLAFAQLDDDTLLVTASRTVYLQPDQALVGVTVNAAANALLDDVVSALGGTGITAANLYSVYTGTQQTIQLPTQWTFSLPVSIAKLSGVLSALAKLQQTLGPNNTSMNLTYFVQNTQASPELQAANPCAYTSLVGDATRQAQSLAAAAGAGVGPILALWDSSLGTAVPTLASRIGDFSYVAAIGAVYSVLTVNPFFAAPQSAACTMTVQFKLLR